MEGKRSAGRAGEPEAERKQSSHLNQSNSVFGTITHGESNQMGSNGKVEKTVLPMTAHTGSMRLSE